MKNMNTTQHYNIRIHGFPGQGAKSAADVLGIAALQEHKHSSSYTTPSVYDDEIVIGNVRISNAAIIENDYIEDADCIIVLDEKLLTDKNTLQSTRKPLVIMNSEKKHRTGFGTKSVVMNVKKFTHEKIQKPLYYIPLLAALVQETKIMEMNTLKQAILIKLGKEKSHWFGRNLELLDEVVKKQEKQKLH